ncbi:MAG TPA: hypothetical protein VFI79_09300 [Gemmatimonadales bacterium]|nr:hypothetical protein [Gemmatimonadales bacterium]
MSWILLPLRLFLAAPGDTAVPPHPAPAPLDWVRALPPARVEVHSDRHEVVIELAPVDLPAMSHMDMAAMSGMAGMNMDEHSAHNPVYPPVMGVDLPLTGWMSGFRIELVDSAGRPVPSELLHHYNLIDPNHRELFLPISRRVLAAGSETGAVRMSRWLMGAPFIRGDRLVASAMLHNPTMQSYSGVRTRLILTYSADGHWYPLLRAYPWQFDVAFPVGDKSFDLPPGRSEKFYEGSPAVAGKIVGIGGHVHDHADSLVLRDITSGAVIWRAVPITDSTGHVVAMPIKKFIGITGIGVKIVPAHRYRVTVFYDNETGQTLPDGGMGVVAGLFAPAPDATWPVADETDSLYTSDLRHALRMGEGAQLSAAGAGVEHTHH